MAKTAEQDLSEEAHRLLQEILETGKATLKSGRVLSFDEDGVLKVIQWLAQQNKKGKKLLEVPDDFKLAQTKGAPDAKPSKG